MLVWCDDIVTSILRLNLYSSFFQLKLTYPWWFYSSAHLCAWNNARRGTWGLPPAPEKIEIRHYSVWCDIKLKRKQQYINFWVETVDTFYCMVFNYLVLQIIMTSETNKSYIILWISNLHKYAHHCSHKYVINLTVNHCIHVFLTQSCILAMCLNAWTSLVLYIQQFRKFSTR
jgi:hypothetical protein